MSILNKEIYKHKKSKQKPLKIQWFLVEAYGKKKKIEKCAKLGLYEQIFCKKHTPDYKTRKGQSGFLYSCIFMSRYTKNSFLCQKLCKFASMLCCDWSDFFSNNSLDTQYSRIKNISYYNSASMLLSILPDNKAWKSTENSVVFGPNLSLRKKYFLWKD